MLLFSEPGSDPVGRGVRAPNFALPTLDGDRRIELVDLAGKVVFLNFWATWCKPCEAEMPAMERLYRSQQGNAFEMLAVSVDQGPEPVREFRDRLELSFPILMDTEQRVAERYQSFQFPETYLIAPDGRVVERFIGPREWDDPVYADRIEALLESGS